MLPLVADTIICARFRILCTAGSGGMGTVYRAQDQHTGQTVALKLLHAAASTDPNSHRFMREAQLLSQLHHPNIVSYIAHGYTELGRPYLAMEWLEGEDLGQRLRRQGLTVAESLALVRCAAHALAIAHRIGIVHRDIKPSNLFLRNAQLERVTLLDFGIARQGYGSTLSHHTRTGMVVGTPQYMAPEQARGMRELLPSVDVFALGCVLFECLSGRPPFVAEHVIAMLAKILFEDPPPLRALRPELPPALDELMKRLLAKDPAARPRDADELSLLLDGLTPSLNLSAPTVFLPASSAPLSNAEQSLVSVILAGTFTDLESQPTLAPEESHTLEDTFEGLRAALSLYGAEAECLGSDSLVATLLPDPRRVATDQAVQAARIALLLRERWPGASIALATGRGVVRDKLPIGEAIDRAGRLLQLLNDSGQERRERIILDDVTTGLLDARFEIATFSDSAQELISERASTDEGRLLLGKKSPCVGRQQELDMLEHYLAACIEDSQSNAVLITAPPGTGKSRLRQEFLRRVKVHTDQIEILFGRGDSMSGGSPYGILRQALLRLCGVHGSEPPEVQKDKLRQRVSLRTLPTELERVLEYLGELCGLNISQPTPSPLQLAPQDPWLMNEQLGQALVDFLRAECDARPLLLILEDLHNADTLSIKLLERVLSELQEKPFFMVALARPEVRDLFPNLWVGRVQEIPLRGLSKKACERLVLEFLGKDAAPETVARVVQQAAGNALFLEELIRACVEGKGDELPETVLAMLQSRLARLPAEVRRVLRAGSLFGDVLWRGGVLALLGADVPSSDLDDYLRELLHAEILELHRHSRFPQEFEYGFRHALMREAAYSLITDEDKRTGHLRAARYLEEVGEKDPLIIAEHYHRGGELLRTIPLYVRAGEAANRICALSEARKHYAAAYDVLRQLEDSTELRRQRVDVLLRQVQFGMLADAPEQNLLRMAEARALLDTLAQAPHAPQQESEDTRRRAVIDLLCGRIHFVSGRQSEAIAYYEKVLPVAEALEDAQLLAIPSLLIGAALLTQGQADRSRPLLARAVALQDRLDSDYERLRAVGYFATSLVMSGQYRTGMALHEKVLWRAGDNKQPAGLSVTHLYRAVSLRLCADFPALLSCATNTLEHCQKSGDLLYRFVALSLIGWAHSFLGRPDEAMRHRAEARALEQELGGSIGLADWFAAADAEIALRAGDFLRARQLAEKLAPPFRKEGRLLALGLTEQVLGLAIGLNDPQNIDEADAHLGSALQVMEGSGQRLAAAVLRLEWARLCRLRGTATQETALRAAAVAQLETSGCAHLISEIERAIEKTA